MVRGQAGLVSFLMCPTLRPVAKQPGQDPHPNGGLLLGDTVGSQLDSHATAPHFSEREAKDSLALCLSGIPAKSLGARGDPSRMRLIHEPRSSMLFKEVHEAVVRLGGL